MQKMKKAISVLTMAIAAALHLIADTDTVNGITWSYERYDGEAWLGEWVDDDYDGHYITIDKSLAAERLVIPSTLGGMPVVGINEWAFKNCSNIESVVIPEGIVEIGEHAFYGCSSLTNVSIPNSMEFLDSTAFQGTPLCASSSIYVVVDGWAVRSTYIPSIPSEVVFDGVRAVASRLFEDYDDIKNLKKITFATSLPCIGFSAFSGCEGLEEVVLPEGLEVIDVWAFANCDVLAKINIPTSVVEIGQYAFVGCGALDNIAISNENVAIGNHAFSSCASLKNVILPESLRGKVSASVFFDCHLDLDLSEYIALEPLYSNGEASCAVWGMSRVGNVRGSLHIPSEHDGLPVMNIDRGAFANKSNIVSVVIDNGVTNIGAFAFQNCKGLKSIVIPDTVVSIDSWAFSGCSSLTNVVFRKSLRRIGTCAFEYCTALQEAILPDGLLNLEGSCFQGCTALRKIDIPGSITSCGIVPFLQCSALSEVVLHDGIGSIGSQWFSGCANLTDITIPDSVTNIGSHAFSGCTKLERISIPAGVESVGYGAFFYCNGLKGIDIASDNPYYTFDAGGIYSKDKSSLLCWVGDPVEVTIPATVTSLGSNPFHGCHNLTAIHVEDGNQRYSSYGGVLYNKEQTSIVAIPDGLKRIVLPDTITDVYSWYFSANRDTIESVVVPSSVTNISSGAFSGCGKLKEVVLPEGITEVPDWCFSSCGNLVSITIPSSVRRIGFAAFMNCTSLEGITIPGGVASIDGQAFMGCSILKEVELPPVLSEISINAFRGCSSLQSIVIPEGVIDIGGSAFLGCASLETASILGPLTNISQSAFRDTGLTAISLPESLVSIGDYAFYGCEKLGYVSIPEHLVGNLSPSVFEGCSGLDESQFVARTWRYNVLNEQEIEISGTKPESGVLVIPASIDGYRVSRIANSAFNTYGGGKFTKVVLPDIEEIGSYAFCNCSNLAEVVFTGGCKHIGSNAFYGCFSLKDVVLPSNLAEIGSFAFQGCAKLDGLELPDSLEEIGREAFVGCESISQIKIPQSVSSLGGWAFEGCSNATLFVDQHLLSVASSLSSYFKDVRAVEFASDVRSLKNHYINLYNVMEITLPESITELRNGIFSHLTNLQCVAILGPVGTIPTDAFSSCTKLETIVLSPGTRHIGLGAFAHCAIRYNSVHPVEEEDLFRHGPFVKYRAPW